MKNTDLNIITDALNKQLNEQAIQEIQQNADLGDEITFAKEMHFVDQHREQIQMQETLGNIFADLQVTPDNTEVDTLVKEGEIEFPNNISGGNNKLWWLSGSLLVILTLAALFWIRPAANTLTEIQRNTLEVLRPLTLIVGFDLESEKDNFSLGFDAYDKGDHTLAVPYLSKYINKNPNDDQVRLYLSISQLFAGNYPESLVNLQTLDAGKNEFIKEHIDWYTGIAHLMNHETEAGINKLRAIQPDNIHFEDAETLLMQIINQ